jgi:hypothetical protein
MPIVVQSQSGNFYRSQFSLLAIPLTCNLIGCIEVLATFKEG